MTPRYVVADAATGEILRIVMVSDDSAAIPLPADGETVAQAGEGASPATHYIDAAGELAAYTDEQRARKSQRPAHAARWRNDAMQWDDLRDLAQVKADKNAQINAWRDAADRGIFDYAGHRVQANDVSKDRMDKVAIVVSRTGALPLNFPGVWKDADNGYVPIASVSAWDAFYGAMVAQGTANFARSEALKAQLAAATTAAQVEALRWEAG